MKGGSRAFSPREYTGRVQKGAEVRPLETNSRGRVGLSLRHLAGVGPKSALVSFAISSFTSVKPNRISVLIEKTIFRVCQLKNIGFKFILKETILVLSSVLKPAISALVSDCRVAKFLMVAMCSMI